MSHPWPIPPESNWQAPCRRASGGIHGFRAAEDREPAIFRRPVHDRDGFSPEIERPRAGPRVAHAWSMTTALQLVMPVKLGRDHIRGSRSAPVTLLEYGDYQCPYCAAAHAFVEVVRQRMGDALRFAFRSFPLTAIHPRAERAAEAAEAAGRPGQFWSMHAVLF